MGAGVQPDEDTHATTTQPTARGSAAWVRATARLTNPLRPDHDQREAMTRLLTAAQVAATLAVPVTWVYREWRNYRQTGSGLPCIMLGRYARMKESDLAAWLEGR